jgi:hypothetical protein
MTSRIALTWTLPEQVVQVDLETMQSQAQHKKHR